MKSQELSIEIKCPKCLRMIPAPSDFKCPKCGAPPRIIKPAIRKAAKELARSREKEAAPLLRSEYPNKSIKVRRSFRDEMKRIADMRGAEVERARMKGDTVTASQSRYVYEILEDAMSLWLDRYPKYR